MTEKDSQNFKGLLQSILNLNQQLNQSLLEESLVLKQSLSAEALDTIASQKTLLVVKLDQSTKALTRLIPEASISNIGLDIIRHIESLAINKAIQDELKTCWLSVEQIMSNNQGLNEQNGATIELLSRHQRRRLQILSGQTPTTQTYGPDGSSRYGLSSKSLASA